MNFYFAYHGCKRTEFKYIQEILKETKYNKMVEPFCGTCSTSYINYYKNEREDVKYIVNDRDNILIDFLKDVKNKGSKEYFKYCYDIQQNENYCKEKHKEIIKEYKENPNIFNYFYFNKCYNFRKGLYPDPNVRKRNVDENTHNKYLKLDEFFKKAEIHNKDYKEIMEKYKNDKNALLYLDPPYFNSDNSLYAGYNETQGQGDKDGYYIINDNTEIYPYIAEYLKKCKCKLILVINGNAVTKYIYKDFLKNEYVKKYNSSIVKKKGEKGYKKCTTHLIISNIDKPFNNPLK
jgi:hypothetical protein